MIIQKEEMYQYQGIKYQIKLYRCDSRYKAGAFVGDRQVTIFHAVEDSTNFSFFKKFGESYAPVLINDVKNDIQQGFLAS